MKKIILILAVFVAFAAIPVVAQVVNPGQAAKDAGTNTVNNNIYNGANNAVDKTENGIKGLFKKKNKPQKTKSENAPANNAVATDTAPVGPSLTAYQNYDFVPGEKILFAED